MSNIFLPLLNVIVVDWFTSGDKKLIAKSAVSPAAQTRKVSQLAIPSGIGGMLPLKEASNAKDL